jgi:hypothetical protein
VKAAIGNLVIVIDVVAVTIPHPPEAAIVFVTVYVPGVLAERSICPVEAFRKISPGVEVNIPAVPLPLKVGRGSPSLLQYGVPV